MKAGGGAVAMATLDSFLQTMLSSSSKQPDCLLLLQFPRFKTALPPPTHSTGLLQGPNSMSWGAWVPTDLPLLLY